MMSRLIFGAFAILASVVQGQNGTTIGSDYIDATPATVYEAETPSPQNMDFDSENNMFVAHSGWYNDRLVHYYKVRITSQ